VFDSHQRIVGKIDANQIYSEASEEPKVHLDLEECLQKADKTQILQGQNAYDCTKCKSPQKAAKNHEIYSVPPMLIICLQRFKNGLKNNELIHFPLSGLDMSKHIANPTEPLLYDLYGVVNHSGTLNFGHYTA
jgi:ubiquitin carboxyl-terminal hydrolase 8